MTAGLQVAAGERQREPGYPDDFLPHSPLHRRDLQAQPPDGCEIEVDARYLERQRQVPVDAEARPQALIDLPHEAVRVVPAGVDAALGEVLRYRGRPVIEGQYHQGSLQPDRIVEQPEQFRERPVQPQQVVLSLQAGGPEGMAARIFASLLFIYRSI